MRHCRFRRPRRKLLHSNVKQSADQTKTAPGTSPGAVVPLRRSRRQNEKFTPTPAVKYDTSNSAVPGSAPTSTPYWR